MKNVYGRCVLAVITLSLATATLADDGANPGPRDRTQIQPGQVIYDFTNATNSCYPEDWTFFGYPQTDFGYTTQVEDGSGAFQVADWEACDVNQYPQCEWAGSGVGLGPFTHSACIPGGISDANLDLSLGTGITVRIKNDLAAGFGGTLGARVALELEDPDGTIAVTPRVITLDPAVNRAQPVADSFQTYTFYFAGMDSAYDNDSAVSGTIPGLNLAHIKAMRLMWRRYSASGANGFMFDKITLLGTPSRPWADANADGAVDMADYAAFQACFGQTPAGSCAPLDANYDGAIDASDWRVWKDCILGPNVTTGFYPWAF